MTTRQAPGAPPHLRTSVLLAFQRLRRTLRERAPGLARPFGDWVRDLAASPRPELYFLHPEAFPLLLLPWWLEGTVRRRPDVGLHRELVYSSICGYYVVRLVDDLMDRDHLPAPVVIPAVIVLHTEFQRAYATLLPGSPGFWTRFSEIVSASADAASRDTASSPVDRKRFLAVSSRKVAGAKIPIAAVAHRYGRTDLVEPWSRFVDVFGRWHQMWNDVLGWRDDLHRQRSTYFLSEARRRTRGGVGEIGAWVVRDGLTWASRRMDGWTRELKALADGLGSAPLVQYLEFRNDLHAARMAELRKTFARLRDLALD